LGEEKGEERVFRARKKKKGVSSRQKGKERYKFQRKRRKGFYYWDEPRAARRRGEKEKALIGGERGKGVAQLASKKGRNHRPTRKKGGRGKKTRISSSARQKGRKEKIALHISLWRKKERRKRAGRAGRRKGKRKEEERKADISSQREKKKKATHLGKVT